MAPAQRRGQRTCGQTRMRSLAGLPRLASRELPQTPSGANSLEAKHALGAFLAGGLEGPGVASAS